MARAETSEDWLLESDGVSLLVSWPEPGDVLHGTAHHAGPPRVSFGFSAVDIPQLAPLTGAHAWLADASGQRMRVRLERIDPELKVAVGEVESTLIEREPRRRRGIHLIRRLRRRS